MLLACLQAIERRFFKGWKMQGWIMEVLRVWLDGQSTATTKGTTITAYPDLEPNEIGVFDDTVLEFLDDFTLASKDHGIKLMISTHSFNALEGGDVYGALYGTGFFYEWENATSQFDNRLRHVLNHEHKTLHQPWRELSDYIFAFEAQNEAMIGKDQEYIEAHQGWQCERANTIKGELGSNSDSGYHGWGVFPRRIQGVVSRAQAAGKKLLFQEWGACFFSTENNNCPTASQITAAGMPWMYWQVIPNADPRFGSDYEIGALAAPAAFDYSGFLL
ncbi:hypothetical protein ACEPAI_706 [Sanghuangporus weigelae]